MDETVLAGIVLSLTEVSLAETTLDLKTTNINELNTTLQYMEAISKLIDKYIKINSDTKTQTTVLLRDVRLTNSSEEDIDQLKEELLKLEGFRTSLLETSQSVSETTTKVKDYIKQLEHEGESV